MYHHYISHKLIISISTRNEVILLNFRNELIYTTSSRIVALQTKHPSNLMILLFLVCFTQPLDLEMNQTRTHPVDLIS